MSNSLGVIWLIRKYEMEKIIKGAFIWQEIIINTIILYTRQSFRQIHRVSN